MSNARCVAALCKLDALQGLTPLLGKLIKRTMLGDTILTCRFASMYKHAAWQDVQAHAVWQTYVTA